MNLLLDWGRNGEENDAEENEYLWDHFYFSGYDYKSYPNVFFALLFFNIF